MNNNNSTIDYSITSTASTSKFSSKHMTPVTALAHDLNLSNLNSSASSVQSDLLGKFKSAESPISSFQIFKNSNSGKNSKNSNSKNSIKSCIPEPIFEASISKTKQKQLLIADDQGLSDIAPNHYSPHSSERILANKHKKSQNKFKFSHRRKLFTEQENRFNDLKKVKSVGGLNPRDDERDAMLLDGMLDQPSDLRFKSKTIEKATLEIIEDCYDCEIVEQENFAAPSSSSSSSGPTPKSCQTRYRSSTVINDSSSRKIRTPKLSKIIIGSSKSRDQELETDLLNEIASNSSNNNNFMSDSRLSKRSSPLDYMNINLELSQLSRNSTKNQNQNQKNNPNNNNNQIRDDISEDFDFEGFSDDGLGLLTDEEEQGDNQNNDEEMSASKSSSLNLRPLETGEIENESSQKGLRTPVKSPVFINKLPRKRGLTPSRLTMLINGNVLKTGLEKQQRVCTPKHKRSKLHKSPSPRKTCIFGGFERFTLKIYIFVVILKKLKRKRISETIKNEFYNRHHFL